MDTTPVAAAPKDPAKRIIPPRPLRAGMVILGFTALLYVIEFVNSSFFHGSLDNYGIRPHTLSGLLGVLFAPLLHVGWQHLIDNTVPVVVFGFLAMAGGLGQWLAVTASVWVVSGLGVWLIGGNTVTVGASGLAFGWLAFLLVRGLFNRSFAQIGVALVLLFYWGSVLWGLLPGKEGISWQGHLFGAIAGVLAAWVAAAANANRKRALPAAPTTPPGPLGQAGNLGV